MEQTGCPDRHKVIGKSNTILAITIMPIKELEYGLPGVANKRAGVRPTG